MPKRKHTKKRPVVACTDANQMVRESIKERERIAEAKQRKFEELRQRYLEEMKTREEMEKQKGIMPFVSPTATPDSGRDAANE